MSKGKEDEKEKGKTMETSTIPSSEVFTFVKKQLEDIGFELSCDKYYDGYSVSTNYKDPLDIDNLSNLIEVLKSPKANFVTVLNLASHNIKGNIKNFVKKLKDTSIIKLDFSDNNLGTKGAIASVDALKQNSKIITLYFNKNNIGDEGAMTFANALKQNSISITTLHINKNDIGNKGAIALAEAVQQGSKLSHLNVAAFNYIEKNGIKALDKCGLKQFDGRDYNYEGCDYSSADTTSTTTTSLSTTSSLEKSSSSSSSSSSSESSYTTLSSDGESVTTLSLTTLSIVSTPGDTELTGQNTTTDVE